MSHDHADTGAGRITRLARRAITAWALLGGCLLLAVVAMNTLSVISAVFWKPLPGDFEMTEMGIAVAAFSFLPWCQMTGANVSADIFTARAGPRLLAVFEVLAALVALGFALILLRQMSLGMVDQRMYGYTTAILQTPIWWAFVPILISLALLAVAALMSLAGALRGFRSGGMA